MGNLRQKYTDEEWDALCESSADCRNINYLIETSMGGENMTFSYGKDHLEDYFKKMEVDNKHNEDLLSEAQNKGFMGSAVGVKYSDKKAPMGIMLKQFPLALEGVAMRSQYGHNKYKDFDHDYMNFKRAPDAINQYRNASVRHLAEIGEDEDSLEHLKAAAWNILATLQLTLEQINNDKTSSTTL